MTVKAARKSLSVFSLVMINVIAIDSLRSLPVNATYGWSIVFFYVLAGLFFFLPGALITAELATEWPQKGGSYIWVREAFGANLSFMNIWLQWIYNVVWYPTILAFVATSIATLIDPNLAQHKYYVSGMIIGAFIIATILNNLGMRISGLISELGALLGTLLPMLLIVSFAAIWYFKSSTHVLPFSWNTLIPHDFNIKNIGFTVIVLYSLMGIEMSAVHAEEVDNPRRDYPRALVISGVLIVASLILGSIAIAVIVPPGKIDIVNGLNEAFTVFLKSYGLSDWLPVIEVLIILGGFAGMCAWVIGPTKGLSVAAQDGMLPQVLAKPNRHGAPSNILWIQALVVIILSASFIMLPTVSSAYWLLSDLTTQLALAYYIILFMAAIKLRYKFPARHKDAYMIPGGNSMMWLIAGLGIFASLVAMVVGFIPPDDISFKSPTQFIGLLLAGMIFFAGLPVLWLMVLRRKNN